MLEGKAIKNVGILRFIISLPFVMITIFVGLNLLSLLFGTLILYINVIPLFLLLFLLVILYDIWVRKKGGFYCIPIDDETYENIKGKHMIHYTNSMNNEDYEYYVKSGNVRLKANVSAKANYCMKYNEKTRKYIWFHQEESNMEPNIDSFYFNHMHENKPRKYKVIIKIKDIERGRILIRPSNHNLVVISDIEVPGIIKKEFNSYNDKIYLKKTIIGTMVSVISPVLYYAAFQQLYGRILDFIMKGKNKS